MAAIHIALLTIRLVMRTKVAFFFTFVFPLVFLLVYAVIFAHGNPDAVAYMFGPVVTLNVMGSGFWGLGLRSVMQRERGGLRRYRLAPIGAGAMVASSLLANYLLQLPSIALLTFCAMVFFHMPLKIGVPALVALVTIGAFAFAGFGLTIASVANTMQEAQVYNNIAWLTLLFLSGTTVPLAVLPHWIQRVAAFLPATYLVSSFQSIMIQSQSLISHWPELLGLVVSGFFGLLFAWKLFRWEKEERIPNSSKLWALVFVIPFLFLGVWINAYRDPTAAWASSYSLMERQSVTASSSARAVRRAEAQTRMMAAPQGSESGLISDFDEGEAPAAKFGSGWRTLTDAQAGGKSRAEINVVSGGAAGSRGSLLIAGEVVDGRTDPSAGAIFFPGAHPYAPANLSSKSAISFWAKGDGKTYRILIFSRRPGDPPAAQTFTAGPDWKEYSFPLTAFQGIDPSDIMGIAFAAGPAAGRFSFQIDEVRLK